MRSSKDANAVQRGRAQRSEDLERAAQRTQIARGRAAKANLLGDPLEVEGAPEDLTDSLASSMLGKERFDTVLTNRDGRSVHERRQYPACKHSRSHRGLARIQRRQERRSRILSLRTGQLEMFARRGIEHQKLVSAVKRRNVASTFAVGDAGAGDERRERFEGPVDRQRFVDRETCERLARARFDYAQTRRCKAHTHRLDRGCDDGTQVGRDVGNDFGGSDSCQFGQELVVRVIPGERGGGGIARRNVGMSERERLANRGHRGKIVILFAVEKLLLDQRTGRYQAYDLAAHETVRLRNFELLGQSNDESLLDEPREISG